MRAKTGTNNFSNMRTFTHSTIRFVLLAYLLLASQAALAEGICMISPKDLSNNLILHALSQCAEGSIKLPYWNLTQCLEKKGVSGKCLEYGDGQSAPTNYLDYLFCVESFDAIGECYRESGERYGG